MSKFTFFAASERNRHPLSSRPRPREGRFRLFLEAKNGPRQQCGIQVCSEKHPQQIWCCSMTNYKVQFFANLLDFTRSWKLDNVYTVQEGPLILLNSKKELSQISRTTGQKIVKLCENLRQGNRNHHEGFHGKRANISATYNDLKFVAIFGQDVPIDW